MLSTPSASAARHASRSSETVVCCGWSCTPIFGPGMRLTLPGLGDALFHELDPATAVAQRDRTLARDERRERCAHDVGSPSVRKPPVAVVQELPEVGARREQRRFE